MNVYHYDDKYAGKNGVNGVKELIAAICVGCAGTIAPATLMGLDMISLGLGLLIIALTAVVTGLLIRRMSIFTSASMSALIDSDSRFYYLTVTPNLRGSSIPRSMTAMLAGGEAVYAENSINAAISASNLAQSDGFVLQLFKLFQDDKIKTTFDTVMYGRPVTVYELLDRDFSREGKKVYHVKCIKNKKRHTAVWIPRAFPAYFG